MQVTQKPETQNETILIQWKKCTFSENIFAWFESNLQPVFSDKMEDLMLPNDYIIQKHEDYSYEIHAFCEKSNDYLYAGRLYVPKKHASNFESMMF